MGCIAGLGRCVLVAVNAASTIVALALIVCGVIIKYVLGDILKSDIIDIITKKVFELFVQNTPVPSTIDFGLFTDTVGIMLIVLGALLLAVSIIGCCAACCSFRCLLILFSVLIGCLVIGQIVFYAAILPKGSAVHKGAKESLTDDLKKDYNRENINPFTISADIIFLSAQCCGVNGPKDFEGNQHLKFNFSNKVVIDPKIPPSCCQHHYIIDQDWDCANNYTMGYSEGCYEKLQDLIADWNPWLVPAIAITLLVQEFGFKSHLKDYIGYRIGEIIAAIMIYKDKDNIII